MALTIQTNLGALSAERNININQNALNKGINRLSSGFRINSAADDAAGFAIASKLSGQKAGLQAASQNALQASAMVKMADASINSIQNMVVRIQTLATQAASANNASDLSKLEAERVKLETQISKIANSSNFNGTNLLNGINAQGATSQAAQNSQVSVASQTSQGAVALRASTSGVSYAAQAAVASQIGVTSQLSMAGTSTQASQAAVLSQATLASQASLVSRAASATGTSVASQASQAAVASQASAASTASLAAGSAAYTAALAFQVGVSNNSNNQVSVDLRTSFTAKAMGLSGGGTAVLTSQSASQTYITTATNALNTLVANRAKLGSTVNQLGFVNASLATSIEQVSAAVSVIKDANLASAMANFTKSQVLVQTGVAMLAQANTASQNVLRLFR